MIKNFLKTASTNAASAAKRASNSASSRFSDLKDANISDLTIKKAKGMNESVLRSWVKDKDAPDEKSFWHKMSESAKRVGEDVAVTGIKSWLAMTDPNTGMQHKAILGAALAYFVLPVDMIPDVIAGVGFTDDAAALALAVNSASSSITEEHETRAREKWDNLWSSPSLESNKLEQ